MTGGSSAAADRQARALALRTQGASYDQIARVLGYANKSGADKAVRVALANTIPAASPLEAYRLEAARCDMVLTALSRFVKDGDPKSVALFLAAMERRTVLAGLIDGAVAAAADAVNAKTQEVRTPLDELHARRAARGSRGSARGAGPAGEGVPAVLPD